MDRSYNLSYNVVGAGDWTADNERGLALTKPDTYSPLN